MDTIYSSNDVRDTSIITSPVDATHMSYAELMSGYNEAIQKAENYRKTIENLQLQNSMMTIQIGQLEEYLVDSFESIDEDTVQALIEIFDLELTREVNFTITAEIAVSVQLPLGKTTDDIDPNDFTIDLDSYEHEFDVYDINIVSVDEN